jgi:hypothetical protein
MRLVVALLALLSFFAAPALGASESGTQGWSLQNLTLRSGPGAAYAVTGEIPAKVAIKVLRCQRLWCNVDGEGGRGWTSKDNIGFGLVPEDWLGTKSPDYPAGGPGQICFFEGTNYTGYSLCAGPGQVFQDLALYSLDNRFSSVEITGDVSAAACRDRFFQSYCERIIESQPVMDRYLARNLSSIRVY